MQIAALVRRHAAAAWHHRWKALALAWLVAGLGWAGVYAIPNQFQSNARIYADADAILASLLRGIAIDNSTTSQVEMLQRTLLSRPNLEKVIARTDLDMRVDSTASRERLLLDLARSIRITPQTRNLFTIEYRDPQPRLAHDVVQAVINLFIESAAGSDRQQIDNARQFLAQQIQSYEVKLREAERRRAEFQARYIDLLPSANGGASRLDAQRVRQQQLLGELQDARMRRELTRQQLAQAPAMLPAGADGGSGESRLAEAERNLRELRLRYTERHPEVISTRNMIAELRASGGGGPVRPSGPRSVAGPRANPLYEQLKVRMVDADAQVASLERQTRDGQAELERLEAVARTEPELVAQYTNLDRDYTVMRRNYEELLARREALQIGDAARTGSDRVKMEVVDPPTVPALPTTPNRPLLLSAALVLGLGAGAALAFLLAQLDTTFYTVHDLRGIGLPVLGGISALRERSANRALPVLAFGTGFALLLLAFGAVMAGPTLLLRTFA
jgi:polysaccharide chain length determinant protein (PEP-CTERM system associated)